MRFKVHNRSLQPDYSETLPFFLNFFGCLLKIETWSKTSLELLRNPAKIWTIALILYLKLIAWCSSQVFAFSGGLNMVRKSVSVFTNFAIFKCSFGLLLLGFLLSYLDFLRSERNVLRRQKCSRTRFPFCSTDV